MIAMLIVIRIPSKCKRTVEYAQCNCVLQVRACVRACVAEKLRPSHPPSEFGNWEKLMASDRRHGYHFFPVASMIGVYGTVRVDCIDCGGSHRYQNILSWSLMRSDNPIKTFLFPSIEKRNYSETSVDMQSSVIASRCCAFNSFLYREYRARYLISPSLWVKLSGLLWLPFNRILLRDTRFALSLSDAISITIRYIE